MGALKRAFFMRHIIIAYFASVCQGVLRKFFTYIIYVGELFEKSSSTPLKNFRTKSKNKIVKTKNERATNGRPYK